jgi:superfamily II DNA or RNA helicase
MASGLGKTATAAFDARRLLSPGGRLLYLCHQNDILAQARETFEEIMGDRYSYGYLHGGEKDGLAADVVFASLQTMRGWMELFPRDEFQIMVVDESHHSHARTYRPVIEYFQPEFLLGLTATPDRADLRDIRTLYGSEVFSLPIEEALARRLLTDVDYRLMTDEIQNLSVLDTPVGRLSIRELNRTIFVPKRDREIVRIIIERIAEEGIEDPRIGVFCPSIDYCDRFATAMPHGAPFHSRISHDAYEDRLRRFRQGRLQALVTVDKFNEGIDVPDLNVLVFLRSTQSRTVFFQQLGRGLRKAPGKTKVLVLDFVANCERLIMVQQLWKDVQDAEGGDGDGGDTEGPFTLHIGATPFTETKVDIFAVIAAIRGGYTKEILVKQLQDLAKELGYTPTLDDVGKASAQGKCASAMALFQHFGSFNGALTAAGFEVNQEGYERDQLVIQLQSLSTRLGRTPRAGDVAEAEDCASLDTFYRHFGSFNNALIAAGFLVNQKRSSYSRQDLITFLQAESRRLGRTPGLQDIRQASKEGRGASPPVYTREFGSFNRALAAAGLPLRRGRV